jgi:tripartite-type tricarboxylate transporter receptor subunit TctC
MSGRLLRSRGALIATSLLLASVCVRESAAQAYPSGPVRVIVPYGAGGATDVLGRVFAQYLQAHLGQSFTIENRAGGAGQIGAAAVANAPADGYTLFFTTTAPLTIAPLTMGKEPRTDFTPIAIVAVQPAWLIAHADSPFKTFADVAKHGKDNPGKLTFGSPGLGSESHLAAEALVRSAGIQAVHVPFRSGAEVIPALLGRQIDLASLTTATVASPLMQGAVRAFAVSSPQRIADFPDVPTFSELGHAGASMVPWWGMMAPPGAPQSIVARIARELESATKDPAVRERLKATFVQLGFVGPQDFARRLDGEVALYGGIIRAANIKLGP